MLALRQVQPVPAACTENHRLERIIYDSQKSRVNTAEIFHAYLQLVGKGKPKYKAYNPSKHDFAAQKRQSKENTNLLSNRRLPRILQLDNQPTFPTVYSQSSPPARLRGLTRQIIRMPHDYKQLLPRVCDVFDPRSGV